MGKNKNATVIAYIGIIAVILFWGIIPSVKKAMIGDSFSASIYSAITTTSSALVLLALSAKHLRELDREHLKIAVPTGLCLGVASLAQALAYNFGASPTNQAFLENLSCLVVPILLFILIRKKPSILTVLASVICLLSSMILAGVFEVGLNLGTADILNALAGVFYGVNIAITGIYAKKLNASLYVMIQMFIQGIFSFAMAIAFNFIEIGNSPIDPFVFTPDILLILALIGVGILTNAVCWTVRTSAMKHVSASVVAVMMPFSAVITGVFAVIIGQDEATLSLLIGAVLGLAASLLSGLGDVADSKKQAEAQESEGQSN